MRLKLLALRENVAFQWTIIGIIVASSISIGARTYALTPSALLVLELLDWSVTALFLFELIVRLGAEKRWHHFFYKGWNWFDFLIVVVSLVPINESEYALLGRLLRLFRVMRLISFIPQLRVLTSALIIALPRMGYVGLLMFVIFYMYAVIGSLLFADVNAVLWGDLGRALLTLFRVATFEDWTDVMYETMAVYRFSWIYYLTFIFLSAFVFLNMMIGVIINVLEEEHQKSVSDGVSVEDRVIHIQQQLQQLHQKLSELSNKNGAVTK